MDEERSNQLGYSQQEYTRAIGQTLHDKYHLGFTVESLGAAYGNTKEDRLNAWVICDEGPYEGRKFLAQVSKCDLAVYDRYLSLEAGDRIAAKITALLGLEQGQVFCEADMDYTDASCSGPAREMAVTEQAGRLTVSCYIFLPRPADGEAARIYELAQRLEAIETENLLAVFCFVQDLKADYYGICADAPSDRRYETVMSLEELAEHCPVSLKDGKMKTSLEQIRQKVGK